MGAYKLPLEHRLKIGESLKGHEVTPETRKAIGDAHRGKSTWNKGGHLTSEWKAKIGASNKGHPVSEDTRRLISIRTKEMMPKGENLPQWNGGSSFEPYCPKFTKEFKERVRSFFGHVCMGCGEPQNGYKLHVHHVNFNKMSCCDDTKPLFVPLCKSCHMKTTRNREYWEQHFTSMITEKYEGKCYD
jgi:hypothetical protein